ncbi:hypothetical protein SAMN02745121_08129 [Nannocystis exedens]|uniref:Uncharacterized protein n=1 Tax=Nannocystis exedens TaxID=54 RepID=A0A1I2HQW1_9BACT|nr:hypothetical protein [Nannocystis exedens]PCC69416.1 hypothetical protein NAEX_02438 [Nannocystis exedens]SFF32072.1 hypothetical protein SAMN02745121_08129 [Nannocystis exedens]
MASHTWFSGALTAIFLLSLPACGDSTATTTATTVATTESSGPNTGTETSTDTTTTTTTATTEAVTTTGPTTGPTTSTTSAPETSTGPLTTGETTAVSATTSETGGETTSAVTTETGGETTTTTTSETTDETTGEPMGATCEQDSDCQVYTDCCTCDVLAAGEQPPACDILECFVDVCSTYDLTPQPPVCRFGRCTFAEVTCNPTAVTCKSQPPNCPLGTLPSVAGDCWSGKCTPVEACNWAPDCATCKTDPTDPLVCVLKGQKGAYHVCEPKPVACGDAPEIDCTCGQEICDASPPHTTCNDLTPGIECACPFC